MPTLFITSPARTDFIDAFRLLGRIERAGSPTGTSTELVLTAGNLTFTLTGAGLSWSTGVAGFTLDAGTVSGIAISAGGVPQYTLSALALDAATFNPALLADRTMADNGAIETLFLSLDWYFAGGPGRETSDAGQFSDDGVPLALTGDNIFFTGGGDASITGGSGDDTIQSGDGEATLSGGAGDDLILRGGSLQGLVFGGTGNDALYGGNGATRAEGGSGRDTLLGGGASDTLLGGDGNDTLAGAAGDDALLGGNGEDVIGGGDGADNLVGGNGADTLEGDAGDDLLSGSTGNDALTGGDGDDSLYGGDGNDTVTGGEGNDLLACDLGNDILRGGAGDDSLTGGKGDDTLRGDAGADRFIFDQKPDPAVSLDRIMDFVPGEDVIALAAAVFGDLAGGPLDPVAFLSGLHGRATDPAHRIIYEQDRGRLYFDADGTGSEERILFARLTPGQQLMPEDFLVY